MSLTSTTHIFETLYDLTYALDKAIQSDCDWMVYHGIEKGIDRLMLVLFKRDSWMVKDNYDLLLTVKGAIDDVPSQLNETGRFYDPKAAKAAVNLATHVFFRIPEKGVDMEYVELLKGKINGTDEAS